MRALAVATALVAIAPSAQAQGRASELLSRAKTLYEQLEVEGALPLLREVLSPTLGLEVSHAERVEAHRYLGAAHTIMGQRDSALAHFRAALDWDPFTDLEPTRFTPAQIEVFAEARRRTFAVAARPMTAVRLDARTEALPITIITTHITHLRAELARSSDTVAPFVLWDGETAGVRELRWNGLGVDGRLAAAGRYRVRLLAESRLLARRDSVRFYFDLSLDGPPLEDTLSDIAPARLLPETQPPSVGRSDLLKGLAVAAGVLVVAGLARDDLGGSDSKARIVAGVAVLSGVAAFARRRPNVPIAENVEENRRRRDARRAANEAVRARNLERLSRTVLIITPAAGGEP